MSESLVATLALPDGERPRYGRIPLRQREQTATCPSQLIIAKFEKKIIPAKRRSRLIERGIRDGCNGCGHVRELHTIGNRVTVRDSP